MNLEIFQESFRNKEINIRPYLLVVSILISVFVMIISFNFTIEDFYKTKGTVKDKNIKLIVDINDLNKVTNNSEIIIERDIFTYEIINISDLVYNDNIYKEVIIKVPELKDLIENDVLDVEIIINKTNILNYLIKTLKGEWHIRELNNDELRETNGGLSLLGVALTVTGVVFVVGIIDGFVNPEKCECEKK